MASTQPRATRLITDWQHAARRTGSKRADDPGPGRVPAVTGGVVLDGLPGPLQWQQGPVSWQRTADDGMSVTAGPGSDLFIDPGGAPAQLSAPRALVPVGGDYRFSARVSCTAAATFDAAVLLVWVAEDRWAKLCLERSPAGVMTVVSVVTRGVSDDANSWPVPAGRTWLRISRRGPATAFHASTDGQRWDLVRHFALGGDDHPQIGVLAQSPTGTGVVSHFDELRFAPAGLDDIRDGS
jgi:uncharacterized protein